MEFRAYDDDAWHPVAVYLEGETLRINYKNLSHNLFELTHFITCKQLQDFKDRFRPFCKHLQDNHNPCRLITKGLKVCASHYFNDHDVRFYDAVVYAVQGNGHSEEEACSCTFILFWLHGPIAGNLTSARIENIGILQPAMDPDPAVASFLKMARERMQYTSTHCGSMSNGVPDPAVASFLKMARERMQYTSTHCDSMSNGVSGLGFLEQLQKGNRCAKGSVVKVCSPEGNFNMATVVKMEEEEDLDFQWGIKRGMGGKHKDVQFYESFTYYGLHYKLFDSVYLYNKVEAEPLLIGKLIKIWENHDKSKKVKVQWFFRPRDIWKHVQVKETLANELFLAFGEGPALASCIPLEAVAGKCNVICISKDTMNPQPSAEELKRADFVSHRSFDVGLCKVLDKLEDQIAGNDGLGTLATSFDHMEI